MATTVAVTVALTTSVAFAQASFNTSSRVLSVPTIEVDGRTYRNLQARLDPDGRLTILALTEPVNPSADFQSCAAPKALSSGSFLPRAVFQTPLQMWTALSGTWQGCDIYGNTVKIAVTGNTAEGTVSRHKNYFSSYTYCTYRVNHNYSFVTTGQWAMTPTSMSCAEGNGLNQANGDVFSIYIKGSPGLATEILLELGFTPFATLVKR
jgi:hypothetical protein